MKAALFFFCFVLTAANAGAQPLLGVFVDLSPGDAGDPLDDGVVSIAASTAFDLVVMVESVPQDFFTYEFSITPLEVVQPGILKTGEVLYEGNFDLGDVTGEYIVGVGRCAATTTVELLRVSYATTAVVPADQTLITLSGTNPSSYAGLPGLAACDGTLLPASFVANGGVDACGAPYPDGSVMLNGCAPQPVAPASFTQIKARY